jgi:hypothetical protein
MGSCCEKLLKIEESRKSEVDVLSIFSPIGKNVEKKSERYKIEIQVNEVNPKNENNEIIKRIENNEIDKKIEDSEDINVSNKDRSNHCTTNSPLQHKSPYHLHHLQKPKFSEELKFEISIDCKGRSGEIVNNISLNLSKIKSVENSFSIIDSLSNSYVDNQDIKLNLSISNLVNPIKLSIINKLSKKQSIFSKSSSNSSELSIFQMTAKEVQLRILQEINEIRLNPLKYSEKIEYYSSLIKGDNIHIPGKNCEYKIRLYDGKNCFFECIKSLEILHENMQLQNYKLGELKSLNELKFELSEKNIEKIDDTIFIEQGLGDIRSRINEKYQLTAFNYRISSIEIEPFLVLHLVDYDNFNKLIQRVILDKDTKYVGINFISLSERDYIIYFIYAK